MCFLFFFNKTICRLFQTFRSCLTTEDRREAASRRGAPAPSSRVRAGLVQPLKLRRSLRALARAAAPAASRQRSQGPFSASRNRYQQGASQDFRPIHPAAGRQRRRDAHHKGILPSALPRACARRVAVQGQAAPARQNYARRTMRGTARTLTRAHDGCCANSFSTCRPIRCRGPPRPCRSAPSHTCRSRSPRCCRMGSGRFLRRRSGGSGGRLRVARVGEAQRGTCFFTSVGRRAFTSRSREHTQL